MRKVKPYKIQINRRKFWELVTETEYISLIDFHRKTKEITAITYNHLTNVINGKEDVSLRVRKALFEIFITKNIPRKRIKKIFVMKTNGQDMINWGEITNQEPELSYAITHTQTAKKTPCA